ncbi:MAG: hypothetical protein E5X63_29850 [Mesorhizobium sp.]|nr:MAG: hypothetical protein E5X63_29850 [Mesorhizobium sp.]
MRHNGGKEIGMHRVVKLSHFVLLTSLVSFASGVATRATDQGARPDTNQSERAAPTEASPASPEPDPAIIVVSAPDGPTLETRARIQRARDLGLPSMILKLENVGLIQDDELMQLIIAELYSILGESG